MKTSLFDLIVTRRSIRRYRPDSVPHELVNHVLKATIWAPSAHNRQPWRFAIVETAACKVQLAQAMGARLRQDLQTDHLPDEVISADVNRSYERITTSPILVVLCVSMIDMDVYADAQRNHHEYLMAVQSVAMAGQNLLLTAHEVGLGACWMCAPLFCPDVVQTALALPDDWIPQGMITLGYPAQEREKTRKPLETSVVWK